MKKLLPIAAMLVISVFTIDALACACCAERGTYIMRTASPSSYDLELLGGFKFAPVADIFMTEADFEIIKGLGNLKDDFTEENWKPGYDQLSLTAGFGKRTWTLDFTSKTGKKGRLVLPMPAQQVQYKVDIHEKRDGDPLLYKEYRFKGRVASGTGFFKSGLTPSTNYFLVFQGRGNGCDNVEDYTHWRLEVNGPKAQYAFYGELAAGN